MPARAKSQEEIVLLSLASLHSGTFDGKPVVLRDKAVRLVVLLYRSDSIDSSR